MLFSLSLFDSGILISLIFLLFPDSPFIAFSCHFLSVVHLLSLCSLYMYYCSEVQIYSLFRLLLGLACIRWVFSSRIYVADSRRDSVSTYFGKRGMTGFSWYQSQVRHKTDLILTDYLNEL